MCCRRRQTRLLLLLFLLLLLLQTLQEHAPDEWAGLPDLQQKREAYYAALEAPNRTLIGQTQVS
jgi:cell division protein FtsB